MNEVINQDVPVVSVMLQSLSMKGSGTEEHSAADALAAHLHLDLNVTRTLG